MPAEAGPKTTGQMEKLPPEVLRKETTRLIESTRQMLLTSPQYKDALAKVFLYQDDIKLRGPITFVVGKSNYSVEINSIHISETKNSEKLQSDDIRIRRQTENIITSMRLFAFENVGAWNESIDFAEWTRGSHAEATTDNRIAIEKADKFIEELSEAFSGDSKSKKE